MKERFPLITYGNKFQPKKDQDGNIIIEKDNDMNTLKTEDLTNT